MMTRHEEDLCSRGVGALESIANSLQHMLSARDNNLIKHAYVVVSDVIEQVRKSNCEICDSVQSQLEELLEEFDEAGCDNG